MEMTVNGRNNLLALSSYEWLDKICANLPTHRLWEDEDFKKRIEEGNSINHEQAINDYNLLKEKGYGDKFIFLEDTKAMKAFFKEIGFQKANDIRFPQKYEKGIIVCGSPYTGINITYGLATASPRRRTPTTMPTVPNWTASTSFRVTVICSRTR